MAKIRRNPNETDEEIVARMNATLVGNPGIVMLTGENRPMYVGTFVRAEKSVNLLIRFTNELVFFFTPLAMVSVVEEKNEEGRHTSKFLCDDLYIGDKTLREIFADEIEEPKPPEPPTVRGLIKETGTFVGCKELTDKFIAEGHIRKDGNVLHVSMAISSVPGCMCGLASRVEEIESLTRSLKDFFAVDEVVYHHTTRTTDMITIIEVDSGYQGDIDSLPGAHKGDRWCGTYPVIRGLGMRWEPWVVETQAKGV